MPHLGPDRDRAPAAAQQYSTDGHAGPGSDSPVEGHRRALVRPRPHRGRAAGARPCGSCVIGMRIADELGLDAATRSRLFYALLMKDAGCSANSAKMAALFGADDHEAKRTAKRSNWSRVFPAFVWSLRLVAPEGSLRARAAPAARDQGRRGRSPRSLMLARCDRGAESAPARASAGERRGIRALDENWDGRPAVRPARRGDPAARAHRLPRPDGRDLPRPGRPPRRLRSGGEPPRAWFDPALAERCAPAAATRASGRPRARRRIGAGAPGPPPGADDAGLDRIAARSPASSTRNRRGPTRPFDLVRCRGPDRRGSAPARAERPTCVAPGCSTTSASSRSRTGARQARRAHPDEAAHAPAPASPRHPRGRSRASPTSRRSPAAHHERLDGSGYPLRPARRGPHRARCARSPSPTSSRR